MITLQGLIDKYPSLLTYNYQQHGNGSNQDLIQTLAACGYRFVEIEDIIRAQKGEENELKDYLQCQLVRIEQCL